MRVRATRTLVERTGYSLPTVEYALDRLFGGMTADALRATIDDELGSLRALDDFTARQGRPGVRYRPAGRAAIVASETTIGVAVIPLAFALLAGCDVLVKDRSDGLVRAVIETLAEEEPTFAAQATADIWDGTDVERSRERLRDADVVIAFGRDETLRAIRSELAPHARFVAFGHRTSVAYVGREALGDADACAIAASDAVRDALLYDGDGCLSPHAVFIERDGALSPRAFAEAFVRACDAFAVEFPPGAPTPVAAALAYRRRANFRASQGDGEVYDAAGGAYVVAFDPPAGEPPPLYARTVGLYVVDAPDAALRFVRRHGLPLEGFARRPQGRPDLEAAAQESGAHYVAALGALQDPPLGGEHGGEGRILPFVSAIYRP